MSQVDENSAEVRNPVPGEDGPEPGSDTTGGGVMTKRWPGASRVWFGASMLLLVLAILSQLGLMLRNAVITDRARIADELIIRSSELVQQAGRAVRGDTAAWDTLSSTADEIAAGVTQPDVAGAAPLEWIAAAMPMDRSAVESAWNRVDAELGEITGARDSIQSLYESVAAVNALSGLMLARSDELVEAIARETGNVNRVNQASRLRGLGETIAREVNLVAAGGDDGVVAASQLGKGLRFYSVSLEEIQGSAGAVTLARLETLQQTLDEYQAAVEVVAANAPVLFSARSGLDGLSAASAALAGALALSPRDSTVPLLPDGVLNWLPLLLLVAALGFSLMAARSARTYQQEQVLHVLAARNRAESTHQQESILKLLDEISALADGDLTISAEVTDQVTGSIADSINFAVEEMRTLVRQINMASVEVANGAKQAVTNARFLSESNVQQSEEISRAAETMEDVASSMQQMSQHARDSAAVASESAAVAKEGTEAVRGTIRGLEDMRNQIQETSKRIKRLGESSQQIGEIVQLIEDIAEQTNILSLNAAIQASMAGDAGRGFAVVADEVQGLAERSTDATARITELVQAIQSDTSDAILSMEVATQEVVAGTRVADSAGQSLGRIESASDKLTGLIAELADQASQEAGIVTGVSGQIGQVRDRSTTTAASARSAADSVNKLTDLAAELEETVARFRLPDHA